MASSACRACTWRSSRATEQVMRSRRSAAVPARRAAARACRLPPLRAPRVWPPACALRRGRRKAVLPRRAARRTDAGSAARTGWPADAAGFRGPVSPPSRARRDSATSSRLGRESEASVPAIRCVATSLRGHAAFSPLARSQLQGDGTASDSVIAASAPEQKPSSTAAVSSTGRFRALLVRIACTVSISPHRERMMPISWIRLIRIGPPPTGAATPASK